MILLGSGARRSHGVDGATFKPYGSNLGGSEVSLPSSRGLRTPKKEKTEIPQRTTFKRNGYLSIDQCHPTYFISSPYKGLSNIQGKLISKTELNLNLYKIIMKTHGAPGGHSQLSIQL